MMEIVYTDDGDSLYMLMMEIVYTDDGDSLH